MSNDEWRTPPDLFATLNQAFGPFTLDAAASEANTLVRNPLVEQNRLRALVHHEPWETGCITKEDDALICAWGPPGGDGVVFCNPPYSGGQILAFMEKALEEIAARRIRRAVILSMADTSTAYYRLALFTASAILTCSRRIPFLQADGAPVKGNRFDSMVFVFDRPVSDLTWEAPRRGVLEV